MRSYHIKTDFLCAVEINGEIVELNKNQFIKCKQDDLIKVYPIECERDCWNFSYVLKLNEQSLEDYKTIKLKDKTIVFLKNKVTSKCNSILIEKSQGEFMCRLTSYPHSFIVEGENYFAENIKMRLTRYEIFFLGNFIMLYGSSKNKDYLLILDKRDFSKKVFIADKIVIDKNVVEINLICKDYTKHALYQKLEIGEEIKEKEYTLFYEKGEPCIAVNTLIVPLAFLECVKTKNYSLAREYLSKQLSKKLTDKHLKKFFGEIDEIIYHDGLYICHSDSYREYKFEFENSKIKNITEVYQS